MAVLCYDSCITLFQNQNNVEIGSIDTSLDIDCGRGRISKIKKSTLQKNKLLHPFKYFINQLNFRSFTCIAFSPDSLLILAGGQSNTFCLYSVPSRILLKSFKITTNISLDGVLLDVDYRKLTEFGNIDLFDLSDSDEDDAIRRSNKKLKLPGTTHGDQGERTMCPTVQVDRIAFNPTGRNFGIISTEGISLYSLDVCKRFDPFKLEGDITTELTLEELKKENYEEALNMSLRLNDSKLIRAVVENFPENSSKILFNFSEKSLCIYLVKTIIRNLELIYAEKLLKWISGLESAILFRHIHFYQKLIKEILYTHGGDFKRLIQDNLPSVISIQQMLSNQSSMIDKL